MRSLGGRILRYAAVGLAVCVLTAGLLLGLALATDTGQRAIVAFGARIVSSADARFEISGFSGSLLSEGRVARIEVHDTQGVWINVEDVTFAWRPWALLGGVLDVGRVQAEKVVMTREPETVVAVPKRKSSSSTTWQAPVGIRLGKAVVKKLELGASVIGVPASLAASANLTVLALDRDITGAINVDRTDGHAGTLAVSFNYNAASGALKIDASAAEPAGGLVARMLESPGLPPLRATLVGVGTTRDLQIGLTVESAGNAFTIGKGRFWVEQAQHRFDASLDGYLATILPEQLRDVLAGRTRVQASGRLNDDGGVLLDASWVRSETLNIEARGVFDPERLTVDGEASLVLGAKDLRAIRLPMTGSLRTSLVGANAKITLSDKPQDRPITLEATVRGLQSQRHGRVANMTVKASAVQAVVTDWLALQNVSVAMSAKGIAATDKRIQDIIAPDVSIRLRGSSNASEFMIDNVVGVSGAVRLSGAGLLKVNGFDGSLIGDVAKLDVFSEIAGRPIGGRAKLQAEGHWAFSGDASKLALGLTLDAPKFNVAQVDRLLAGKNLISATLYRDASGTLKLEDVKIAGAGLKGDGSLQVADGVPSGQMQLGIIDLRRLDPVLSGSASGDGTLAHQSGTLSATLNLTGDKIQLRGKPIEGLMVKLRADGALGALKGEAKLEMRVDDVAATGRLRLSQSEASSVKLNDIAMQYGRNQLKGWLAFGGSQTLIDGNLVVDAPSLKAFSTLVGKPISGKLTARMSPTGKPTARRLILVARADNLKFDGHSIVRATVDAELSDALSKPQGFGRVRLEGAQVGGRTVSDLTLAVDAKDGPIRFGLEGRGGAETVSAGGIVELAREEASLTVQRARLTSSDLVAKLVEPALIRFANGEAVFKKVRLAVGQGQIIVSGKTGGRIQINAALSKLPLSLANVIAPDIAADGELSGTVNLSGSTGLPVATFKLSVASGTMAALREVGIAPLAMTANGNMKNELLTLQAKATGAEGVAATVSGSVNLRSEPKLNLRTIAQLPLSVLNVLLAERGTRGSGLLKGNIAITGTAAHPQLNGTATIAGGAIHDPGSGIRLSNLRLSARIKKSQFSIDQFEAAALPGGRLSGTGRVLFDAAAGFPVTAQLQADGLKLQDQKMLNGKLDGQLAVSGALQRRLLVAGNVALQRFDIIIPERLPRTVRELDVSHVNLSKQERAELGIVEKNKREGATTPIQLDLNIKSDSRIFVRGRGLDAQLGGGIRLRGTAERPIAEGEFRLIRGRLAIVGRRLIFNRGTIGFAGSLDPSLDFAANSDVDGTVITTTVSGRASNPKLAFTSSPQLPEDELLARLLFNQSLTKLSPLQVAQLASEVDKLGGLSSGPGVMEQLRKSVGVDVLDVSTDKKGNAAVSAGKYVNSQTYVGVQQNTGTNTSRVIVDIDITKNIKAHGETGSDGNSKLGVGVEWNY